MSLKIYKLSNAVLFVKPESNGAIEQNNVLCPVLICFNRRQFENNERKLYSFR